MRILSISTDRNIFDVDSAVRYRHIEYAKRLGSIEIVVFTLAKDGHKQTEINGSLTIYPTNSRNRWLYIVDAVRIGKTIKKPDVITAQDPFETGLVARVLSRYFKAKLHIQIHTDITSIHFAQHSLLNKIRMFIAPFILRKANAIRVVSNRIKEGIESKYNLDIPITVLPIFVDPSRFRDTIVNEEIKKKYGHYDIVLLSVGRLESEKNTKLALKALKFILSEEKNVGLIIVGDGSLRAELEGIAEKYGISSNVHFVGQIDPVQYYALVDVLLVTSKYEGYGIVIIEALFSGTHVLSTDVGIAQEVGVSVAYSEIGYIQKLLALISEGIPKPQRIEYQYKNEEDYIDSYVSNLQSC